MWHLNFHANLPSTPQIFICMKKINALLLFVFSISCSFAQVQRIKPVSKPADSSSTVMEAKAPERESKKEMMKELSLTKEQKMKLKEIRQANKAAMDDVTNDAKLTADEKKAKLKSLRMEQLKNTMAILNDEQKVKMKQMRMQRQKEGKAGMEMEEQ